MQSIVQFEKKTLTASNDYRLKLFAKPASVIKSDCDINEIYSEVRMISENLKDIIKGHKGSVMLLLWIIALSVSFIPFYF
jgi:hypothetical protein